MKPLDFNQWTDPTDFERNELVFEKRNKAYGAYFIRKNYNQTLIRALVISVSFVTSLFLIPKITQLFAKETLRNEWDIVTFDMTPPEPTKKDEIVKVEKKVEKAVQKKNDTKTVNIWKEIVDSNADFDTLTVDKINNLVTGVSNNSDGDSSSSQLAATNGDTDSGVNVLVDKTEDAVIYVSEMPEFVGGNENIPPYLGNNIVFPPSAMQDGKDARVVVSFIIEKDGSISNVKILSCNETGYGFEKEAMRVISAMPNWKPGSNNGHPARVLFNIPIFFRLM